MRVGDTFYFRGPENPHPHLWVVLSDPNLDPSQIVIASMTSWKEYKDSSCILAPDDHPNLTHQTCIDYSRTRVFSHEQLDKAVSIGVIDFQEPVSRDVLLRIQKGGVDSQFMRIRHRQILIEQGLG